MEYTNVPPTIATVVSGKLATLIELQTVYGIEDMWDLIEIITVDNNNARIMNEVN